MPRFMWLHFGKERPRPPYSAVLFRPASRDSAMYVFRRALIQYFGESVVVEDLPSPEEGGPLAYSSVTMEGLRLGRPNWKYCVRNGRICREYPYWRQDRQDRLYYLANDDSFGAEYRLYVSTDVGFSSGTPPLDTSSLDIDVNLTNLI